jgi:hypothetical protein
MSAYRGSAGAGELEITEQLARRTFALPTGPSVSVDDIRTVCDLVRSVIGATSQPRSAVQFTGSSPILTLAPEAG